MASFIMSVVAPLLALAGLSLALTRHFRIPIYSAPLCAAGIIVTSLYVADFASLLKFTSVALLVVGIGLLIVNALQLWKTSIIIERRHRNAAAALLLVLVWLAFLNYRIGFTQWDEFSHWGTFTKLLYFENTFQLKELGLRYYFEDYPPGTALFSYFFMTTSGYSEPVVYFVHGVILLCGCLPTVGMAMSSSQARGLLAIFGCFLLVMVLGQGWSSALIDHIVSILFAGIICAFWTMRNSAPSSILALIPPLCFLILSKQSGASFAVLATGLIFGDRIWVAYQSRGWRAKLSTVAPVVLLWVVPRAIQASWTWHVEARGLTKGFSATNAGDAFAKLAGCCQTERELVTIANFVKAMTGLPSALPALPGNLFETIYAQIFRLDVLNAIWLATGPSHLKILVLLCGLITLTVYLQPNDQRARLGVFSLVFVAAGALYATSLLVYYLYVFSDYEGRSIASHERFINTYLLALALFALGVLLATPAVNRARSAVIDVTTILFLIVFCTYLPSSTLPLLLAGGHRMSQTRAEIREFLKPLISATDKQNKVYAIWESTSILRNGYEFWVMHYELRPRNTNHFCFSLGPPQYKGDLWSCDKTEDQVRREFDSYQTVVVGHGLSVLQKLYPEVFADTPVGEDRGIFETFTNAENELALRPMRFATGSSTQ